MFLRALWAFCFVAWVGCDDASSKGALNADAGRSTVLSFDPQGLLRLSPLDEAKLVVRVRDEGGEAMPNVRVFFALEGDALGASLKALYSASDAQGMARTTLSVGSEASKFLVRATAAGADPARLSVEVAEVLVHSVLVNLTYDGVRQLATHTVTARPNVDCPKALEENTAGALTRTITDPDPLTGELAPVTFALDPGFSYAVVAWGRDATGGLLARGCTETVPPLGDKDRDEAEEVNVTLFDHEMSLRDEPYPIEFELNVEVTARRLANKAKEVARARLPVTYTPNADYLLDAIAEELSRLGKTSEAMQLATERDANQSLAGSLELALKNAMVGPSAMLDALSLLIGTRSPRLLVDGTFRSDGSTMTFVPSAVYAREGDGGTPLALKSQLSASLEPRIEGAYDQATAKIAVRELSMTLAMSAYGQAVYDALDALATSGLLGTYRNSMGCKALATWSAMQPAVANRCDAGCVASACQAAQMVLLKLSRDGLGTFATHDDIFLMGDVAVSDRGADHVIDSLGPSTLLGAWAVRATRTDPDGVTGKLNSAEPTVVK